MKFIKTCLMALMLTAGATIANAQSLSGLLGNVIQGVFSSSDITVADIAGSYVSNGPAVTFKSDNFLKKAGGVAAAAALEDKLAPYYTQYGLTGMTLEIDADANFSMKVKGITLKGVITKNEGDGTFDFNLSVLGQSVGHFTAYIEKSLNSLKVMFDADKLMQILSTVAKFTGNSIVSTVGNLLSSYDGTCIGFNMTKTGEASSSGTVTTGDGSESSSSDQSSQSAVGGLLNLIKKK